MCFRKSIWAKIYVVIRKDLQYVENCTSLLSQQLFANGSVLFYVFISFFEGVFFFLA